MEPTEPERPGVSVEEVEALRQENRELKARLDRIDQQRQAKREVRKQSLRIGWGVLVPLLDRHRVVRSFGEFSNQVVRLADPRDRPEPREVAESAREFLSCCVRFVIRRRLFFLLFALLAAAVPAIQLWLVLQQNQIVQRQNDFFEIQLYDVVARSMSEDSDEENRKITGLLLANADPTFLHNVVREVFDPNVANVLREDQLSTPDFKAVGYRGPLLRSLARGLVLQRDSRDDDEIYAQARPSLVLVYRDAAERLPRLLRWSRNNPENKGGAEVHYYLEQLGQVLRVHSRLARTVDKSDEFYAATAPLFAQLARVRAGTSPFDRSLRFALEAFVLDLAQEPDFGAPEVDLGQKDPEVVLAQGLQRLSAGLQKHKIEVAQLGAFVGASAP